MEDFNVNWTNDFSQTASEVYDAPTRKFAERSQITASKRLSIFEPRKQVVSVPIRRRFAAYVKQWRNETAFKSSSHDIYFNLSYQRIIGMGPDVLPLIREQLESAGGDWFWALSCITGKDPVPEDKWGNYAESKKIWLNWLDRHS